MPYEEKGCDVQMSHKARLKVVIALACVVICLQEAGPLLAHYQVSCHFEA